MYSKKKNIYYNKYITCICFALCFMLLEYGMILIKCLTLVKSIANNYCTCNTIL